MAIMKGSIKTKLDELAYARDGYKCEACGRTTGIEAHHKIPGLEVLDNLLTLCHACHKKQHNMSGCFIKGDDPRRGINTHNLNAGNCLGHPFWGNRYRNADGTLKN